ncbi:MAG: DUF3592 domain-containing protein [Anaerolineae bacterium]|nr:DUF3592 domain-containing protein [Anaerolineae bacterium]
MDLQTYGWPILIVAFSTILALYLLGKGVARLIKHNRLSRDGVAGRARVVKLETRRTGRNGLMYGLVTVELRVQGQTFQHQHDVSAKDLDAMQPGQSINVRYLPQQPEVAELTGARHSEAYHLVWFAAAVILGLALLSWVKLLDLMINGTPW